jgi:flagellar basal-body rod protein FlgB
MSLPFARLNDTINHALTYRLQRNNVISSNLANIDTPGYTPVELKFETQLRSFFEGESPHGLNKTNARHVGVGEAFGGGDTLFQPIAEGEMEFDVYALPDQKGNSVDLDHESGKLAENQLMYRTIIAAYNKRSWYSRVLEG